MGLLQTWTDILDQEEHKIELNICVIASDGTILTDHPSLNKFYEAAFNTTTNRFKDNIEMWYDSDEDEDIYDIPTRRACIIDDFKFAVIEIYLEHLNWEKYLYVYDYSTGTIRWVWMNSVKSADIAESDDKIAGMKLYKKAKGE